MKQSCAGNTLIVFPSDLGWMAVEVTASAVRRLSFGYPSADAAMDAMNRRLPAAHGGNASGEKTSNARSRLEFVLLSADFRPAERRKILPWQRELVELLRAYASGSLVDFSSVPIELQASTSFRRNVLNACRKIRYGRTLSYGQLAAKVGAPGAARAVGTCMAKNPLPLIIPCHRVTRTGGAIGPFSAVGGTKTKRRLLDMEAARA